MVAPLIAAAATAEAGVLTLEAALAAPLPVKAAVVVAAGSVIGDATGIYTYGEQRADVQNAVNSASFYTQQALNEIGVLASGGFGIALPGVVGLWKGAGGAAGILKGAKEYADQVAKQWVKDGQAPEGTSNRGVPETLEEVSQK